MVVDNTFIGWNIVVMVLCVIGMLWVWMNMELVLCVNGMFWVWYYMVIGYSW